MRSVNPASGDSQEIRKLLTIEFMFLLDLFWRVLGGWRVVKIALGENSEKWGDRQKKKLFISQSVETLIPLKEGYQGLLKLHVHLRGVLARRGECPKRKFCLKQKHNIGGGLSGPIEILYIIWRRL